MFSLMDWLRQQFGGSAKKKSAFANEKEAYDFCRRVYKETGGAPPELRRLHDFYQAALNDQCASGSDEPRDRTARGERSVIKILLRNPGSGSLGEKKVVQAAQKGAA